jgi:hypothetical protein
MVRPIGITWTLIAKGAILIGPTVSAQHRMAIFFFAAPARFTMNMSDIAGRP